MEHGDRMWFSEAWHFERRPIPVRTTINPRHQLPHDQSRCITCTLYCHVGQAWYLPQTTDFMCHDEDVAKIELASLRGQSWTAHFCLRSGAGVGPPVVPVRDATNFMCSIAINKTLQLHPRQMHWATLLQAASERITARPTSGVSDPHKFHVSNQHKKNYLNPDQMKKKNCESNRIHIPESYYGVYQVIAS